MGGNVFVYGTLMFPETKITDATRRWLQVLQALLRRQPRAAPAFVTGYSRHAIKGQVFPGTIPAAVTSQVEGLVLFGLSPEELTVFDAFEGDEYVKTSVHPRFLSGGRAAQLGVPSDEIIACDMYVWRDSLRPLLRNEGWDADAFREQHLGSYTAMCEEFAAELREQAAASSRPFTWGQSDS